MTVVPRVAVKNPALHFVWDIHASVLIELLDSLGLNIPDLHGLHTGCLFAVPDVEVKNPALHLVCCTHLITPP